MRPSFEKVVVPDDQSWTLFDRQLPSFPFLWHYHPEFELTLTLNSSGERFIGDHVSRYGDADLALIGPNLPHTWRSRAAIDPDRPHRALVVWFSEEWARGLTGHYREWAPLKSMLLEAGRGLAFSNAVRQQVVPRLLALGGEPPALRWLRLLEVLLLLAEDRAATPLASHGFVTQGNASDQARLERVLSHLHAHYLEAVRLSTLAELAAMSESQLQRFFKRRMRMTVSDYLAQLRIGRACALLIEQDRPIAVVAAEAGYSHPSYFTRQFRAVKGMTPGEFRRRFGGS